MMKRNLAAVALTGAMVVGVSGMTMETSAAAVGEPVRVVAAAQRVVAPTVDRMPAEQLREIGLRRTTGGCSGGVRCWVHLNRAETWALGWGPVPKPPSFVLRSPVLAGAYYALAYGHRIIARGWYKRGKCVTFLMSLVPWENNGMTGRRC